MKIFQGPPSWGVVLALSTFCLCLLTACGGGGGGEAEESLYDSWQETQAAVGGLRFRVNEATLTRRREFAVVGLNLSVENSTGNEFAVIPPEVRLMVVSEDRQQMRPLNLYFQAFQEKPVVPAGQTRTVNIQYMLPTRELAREMKLYIADNGWTIKNAGAAAYLNNLPLNKPVTFDSRTWGD